jgi:hypothetical protein
MNYAKFKAEIHEPNLSTMHCFCMAEAIFMICDSFILGTIKEHSYCG